MAYYLMTTFVIYILVDYKAIYTVLDKTLMFSTSGSKLNYETHNDNNIKNVLKEFSSYTIIDWSIIFLLIFLIVIFNYSISSYIFNIKPLVMNVFSKEFNLTEICSSISSEFKIIYNISSIIFAITVILSLRVNILNFAKKLTRKLIVAEVMPEPIKNEYIIAKNSNDECFAISENALFQNVLITGGIGSGKTSGAISRICYNLIKSGKGGLILDVKGNFVNIVERMCKETGRDKDLQVVSNNSNTFFELLDENNSALQNASNIRSVISLLSITNSSDPYWLDKVENVLMNLLILMKYNAKQLDFITLHKMVTDLDYLKSIIYEIESNARKAPPQDKEAFELANAITFVKNEYMKLDSRVLSIVRSEITRITIPLITEYDTYNQFCVQGNKEKVDFNNNKIVVLSINIGKNRALAKIISTFLKLSFQKYVLSNISNKSPNFFIADEFQEFCNIEDSHFLSLSREAKCINIISTQSYSSLRSALKDNDAASVIIQNLVNKIWFRNDDNYTIEEIIKQLGKVYKIKKDTSVSESCQESKKYIFKDGFKSKKSGISRTLNYVSSKENEYDENYFSRELKNFEALAFITDGEKIMKPQKIIFERWK